MKKKKSTKRLFYRNAPYLESLVFAPPKVAEYNSAIHHALFETDDAHDADKHHTLPQSNEPFDPEFWFPGFSEGDYPDWLQQKQDFWLPPATLKHFARYDTSVLNGPFWTVDPP